MILLDWIKNNTGLGQALLRMPPSPSLLLGVFSSRLSALLRQLLQVRREPGWSPGDGKVDQPRSGQKML